jgi:hypothetical protein
VRRPGCGWFLARLLVAILAVSGCANHSMYATPAQPARRKDHYLLDVIPAPAVLRLACANAALASTGSGPAIRRGNETEVIKMDSYCVKCGRFRPLTSLGVMCRECLQRWRPTRGPRSERPSWLAARLQITG